MFYSNQRRNIKPLSKQRKQKQTKTEPTYTFSNKKSFFFFLAIYFELP
jgi:hypothetical protein